MSKIKTGGYAFPIPLTNEQEERWNSAPDLENANGMTLRDYFAAKAMQGICVGRSHSDLRGHVKASAKVAYAIADAMLEARDEQR